MKAPVIIQLKIVLALAFALLAVTRSQDVDATALPLKPQASVALLFSDSLGEVTIDFKCGAVIRGLRLEGDIELKYLEDASVLSFNIIQSSQALPYSSEHDVPTSTWTVTSAVDRCAPLPAVVVWCGSCTAAGGVTLNGVAIAATSDRPLGSAAIVVVLYDANLFPLTTRQTSTQRRSLLQDPPCSKTLIVAGKEHTFDHCIDLGTSLSLSQRLELHYTLEPPAPGSNGTTLYGGILATSKEWAGIGFPTYTNGGMLGSNAIIMSPNSQAPSGAIVDGYVLSDYNADVVNDSKGSFPLKYAAAELTPEGILKSVFTATLPYDINTLSTSSRRIIYAMGTTNGDLLNSHITSNVELYPFGRATVQFQPGSESSGGSSSESDSGSGATAVSGPNTDLVWAHAWLMTIGWGVLIPMGAVVAHSFKHIGPAWFHLHRILQLTGLTLGYIGLGLIFKYASDKYPNAWEIVYTKHRDIGITVMVLGAVQALVGFLRPHPGTKHRPTWHAFHVIIGVSAVGLAIGNIYYGILKVQDSVKPTEDWTWIVYTVFLAVVVATAMVADLLWRNKGDISNTNIDESNSGGEDNGRASESAKV